MLRLLANHSPHTNSLTKQESDIILSEGSAQSHSKATFQVCIRLLHMSSPAHTSWFSAGTLLSCVTVLLFCAGFLRVELKMKEQEIRMDALEVKLSSQSAEQHSFVFGEWFNSTIDSLLVS